MSLQRGRGCNGKRPPGAALELYPERGAPESAWPGGACLNVCAPLPLFGVATLAKEQAGRKRRRKVPRRPLLKPRGIGYSYEAWGVSEAVITSPFQGEGHGFESRTPYWRSFGSCRGTFLLYSARFFRNRALYSPLATVPSPRPYRGELAEPPFYDRPRPPPAR